MSLLGPVKFRSEYFAFWHSLCLLKSQQKRTDQYLETVAQMRAVTPKQQAARLHEAVELLYGHLARDFGQERSLKEVRAESQAKMSKEYEDELVKNYGSVEAAAKLLAEGMRHHQTTAQKSKLAYGSKTVL